MDSEEIRLAYERITRMTVFSDEIVSASELNRFTARMLDRASVCPLTVQRNGEKYALLSRNLVGDMVALLRSQIVRDVLMQTEGTYATKSEFEQMAVALGKEKTDNERLRAALDSLLPGLELDLSYASDDDDKDALRSRVRTVRGALSGELPLEEGI